MLVRRDDDGRQPPHLDAESTGGGWSTHGAIFIGQPTSLTYVHTQFDRVRALEHRSMRLRAPRDRATVYFSMPTHNINPCRHRLRDCIISPSKRQANSTDYYQCAPGYRDRTGKLCKGLSVLSGVKSKKKLFRKYRQQYQQYYLKVYTYLPFRQQRNNTPPIVIVTHFKSLRQSPFSKYSPPYFIPHQTPFCARVSTTQLDRRVCCVYMNSCRRFRRRLLCFVCCARSITPQSRPQRVLTQSQATTNTIRKEARVHAGSVSTNKHHHIEPYHFSGIRTRYGRAWAVTSCSRCHTRQACSPQKNRREPCGVPIHMLGCLINIQQRTQHEYAFFRRTHSHAQAKTRTEAISQPKHWRKRNLRRRLRL